MNAMEMANELLDRMSPSTGSGHGRIDKIVDPVKEMVKPCIEKI